MNAITNIFPHYSDDYSDEINWNYLDTIPEIARLKDCPQNPKCHSEGTAYDHTRLCLEKFETEVLEYEDKVKLSQDVLMILRVAILLHDIGKTVTTSIGKDGNYHSYGHEIEGEKIARVMLWGLSIPIRERICAIVRYHMTPLSIFDSKNWVEKMLEISTRVPWKYLYYVKKADILGSIQKGVDTKNIDLMKLDLIKQTAQALNIWDTMNATINPLVKYFSNRDILPWKTNLNVPKKPIAVLMIGLPGAGKNTWIENNISQYPDAIQLSRDDLRAELGFCLPGEKYLGTDEEEKRVTEVYDERLNQAIKEKRNIILNNVHLRKKYRDVSVQLLRKAGYYIEYVYVEAPSMEDNFSRREGDIRPDRIRAMALSFEWAETTEYDKLTIAKQYN